jgi:hypothetical protein
MLRRALGDAGRLPRDAGAMRRPGRPRSREADADGQEADSALAGGLRRWP